MLCDPIANWTSSRPDDKAVARSSKAPQDDVSLRIEASGFRPVRWILGNGNELLRAFVAPRSSGSAVDERGNPIAGAWITNEPPQFRADGYAYVPERGLPGENWSEDDGRFELTTDLTLRNQHNSVPFIAIDPNLDRMAIRIVLARADSGDGENWSSAGLPGSRALSPGRDDGS